jgi:N-acylneuraminate cytidylyltransferase
MTDGLRICVIPARGGSKRIPRKNILPFGGRPMIAWSIAAARDSGLFDHILVSTDDAEIAAVAREHGAELPFIRPDALATDHAGSTEVVTHATRWATEQGWPLAAVCCIYATAPFIQADDLRRGLAALDAGDWAYAFSVTDYAYPIFRSLKPLPDGGLGMHFPEHYTSRSQDLPEALHDAGQFYWGRPQAWLQQLRIFDAHSTPVHLPRWRVQDIDTPDDWRRAELMHDALRRAATGVTAAPPHQGTP